MSEDEPPEKPASPNKAIDKHIKDMMKKAADGPVDIYIKGINTAIAWEKVRHAILDKDDPFDPDSM